jgi:hypothetical protein
VIKTLEAQVGQFLLGCKFLVNRFLPGRTKDLSAPLYVVRCVCAYMPNPIRVYVWVRIRQFTRRYGVESENLQPAADIRV